jgi:L-lactate dehydrogenase complex protein LldG
MASAKHEILNRINGSLAPDSIDYRSDYTALPRSYRQTGTLLETERIELLIDRLLDYGSEVHFCYEHEIAETVAQVSERRNRRWLVSAANLPAAWLPPSIAFIDDDMLSYDRLNSLDGVITGCALAIASTGTIVLKHGPGDGRRALSLIPDYHLCILFANQIVETVPEAIRRMTFFSSVPITTISGPSATSDIEMTRIKGVHGPRLMDVILVRTRDNSGRS